MDKSKEEPQVVEIYTNAQLSRMGVSLQDMTYAELAEVLTQVQEEMTSRVSAGDSE